jgi:LAGLIDADG-like domain
MREKRNLTWTADLAYVIGLIATDGCLSSDGRHVIFTSRDLDLIQTFSSILHLENEIGITRNRRSWAYRVQFGDVQLYRWLLSIGLTPNKSLTMGALAIPPEFFIDFLRGHLDGDGSITTYTDRYNTFKNPKYIYERVFVRFISASEKHIAWLQSTISMLTGIRGAQHTAKPKLETGRSMYILKFGKKSSLELVHRMYYSKNVPALERKRAVAHELMKRYE